MSNSIVISYDELREEVLEDWLVEEIGEEFVKHDTTRYTCVFKHPNGKHYKVSYEHSYSNGIEDYDAPYTAYEVEQKQVIKTVWKLVK